MELPLVLPHRRQGIYAVLHLPADFGAVPRRPGVLMVHAEGGSKVGHKRSFVELARRLESGGVASLRLDLLGEGESEELTEDPFVAWRGLGPAVAYFREHCRLSRLVLLGDCFGGLLSAHYARLDPRVDAVVVWNLTEVKWTSEQLGGFAGETSAAVEDLRRYWQKLWTREPWAKLLSLRLQPGELLRRGVRAPAGALARAGYRRLLGTRRGRGWGRAEPAPSDRRLPVEVLHAQGALAGPRTLAIARHVFAGLGVDARHRVLKGREFSLAWKEQAYALVEALARYGWRAA